MPKRKIIQPRDARPQRVPARRPPPAKRALAKLPPAKRKRLSTMTEAEREERVRAILEGTPPTPTNAQDIDAALRKRLTQLKSKGLVCDDKKCERCMKLWGLFKEHAMMSSDAEKIYRKINAIVGI